jgi:rhodanese-related sulfurtransferase
MFTIYLAVTWLFKEQNMTYIIIAVVLITIVFLVTKKSGSSIPQINSEELNTLLKEKQHQFVDVRTPSEFAGKKIKGFQNIPLASLEKRIKELKLDKTVVVICASGARSMSAANTLTKLGFTVINVRGGIAQYRA